MLNIDLSWMKDLITLLLFNGISHFLIHKLTMWLQAITSKYNNTNITHGRLLKTENEKLTYKICGEFGTEIVGQAIRSISYFWLYK